jgi:DNA-binding LacI/PurR family transcriptional regulator
MCLDVNHPDFARVLRRTSLSQANFFIVHGTQYFPFDLLKTKAFAHKTVIGILDWESEVLADTTHRVLLDHTAGGRQVAAHFRKVGHRKVLLAGNGQMLWFAKQEERRFPGSGHGFLEEWGDPDGSLESCIVLESGASVEGPEADQLLALLAGPDAPTAVFALMDANGAWIQSVLLARAPQLLKKIELVGYGNTPWSQAAHPAFSSVDWNLEAVVRATSAVIDGVQDGTVTGPKTVWIQPVFIKR